MDADFNAPSTFNVHGNQSREDVNVRIMNIDAILDNDQNMDEEVDDSDYDETDWDRMHAKT